MITAGDLVEFTISMRVPRGAPAGGIWSEIKAGEDGRESVYYVDKNGKGYPMILPDDPDFAYRALVVNHVLVSVDLPFDQQFKATDVEEFLGTLDLGTLARL